MLNAIPAPQPIPYNLGLVSQAIRVDDGERWEDGFSFRREGCAEGGAILAGCTPGSHDASLTNSGDTVEYQPFLVFGRDRCSTFGFEAADYQGRARRQLGAVRSHQIEAELWNGAIARSATPDLPNRYLAHASSNVVNASATSLSPADALACLEEGLSFCGEGTRGMIHATRQIVTEWAAANLLRREGGYLLTHTDTIVVAGTGYSGDGPHQDAGSAPIAAANGSIWAYATDMIYLRLGEVKVIPGDFAQAINRAENHVEYRAEQLVAAYWDGCCHLAVEIDADLCGVATS